MSAITEAPPTALRDTGDLIDRGLAEARAVSAEEVRADHVAAWILRLGRAEPGRAKPLLPELDWDPGLRARALTMIAAGMLRQIDTPLVERSKDEGGRARSALRESGRTRGGESGRASSALRESRDRECSPQVALDVAWGEALAAIPAVPEPDLQIELFNDLCEAAIAAAERDRDLGRRLLEALQPAIETLGVYPEEQSATRALGAALLAEALAALGDPAGAALFERAEVLSRGYGVRDRVLAFAAQSDAGGNRERALAMAAEIEDPWSRFETRAGLLQRDIAQSALSQSAKRRAQSASDPSDSSDQSDALRSALCALRFALAEDAAQLEPMRRSQAFARIAALVWSVDEDTGREYYDRALAEVDGESAQLRALQLAAVAASISASDKDWAAAIYQEAMAAAQSEPEAVRGVVARIAIAFQMGHRDPESAQVVLDTALTDAASLEALWELAHVAEILFDARGRPELNLSAAGPLLEAALTRIGDDDPRLPGVLGLPDVGHCFAQFDPERARGVFERWLAAAMRTGDADSMLHAARALHQLDSSAGLEGLHRVARQLVEREDCFGLSQFCLGAAEVDPDLVARVAPLIPESRERTRSLAAAAAGLYARDPEGAAHLLEQLPAADERSAALLTIADALLGTGELPRPMAESSFSVCCSTIPQLDPAASAALRLALGFEAVLRKQEQVLTPGPSTAHATAAEVATGGPAGEGSPKPPPAEAPNRAPIPGPSPADRPAPAIVRPSLAGEGCAKRGVRT